MNCVRLGRWSAVAFASLFWTLPAFGAKFTQREFKVQLPAAQETRLELRPLLKDVSSGVPLRFVFHNEPEWLRYDSVQYVIAGRPPTATAAVHRFGVEVYQGAQSDFAYIELSLFVPPKWKHTSLDLGAQYEGRRFTLDLNSQLDNRSAVRLSFTATGLPRWMVLNGSTLEGTPSRTDVGPYSGIVLKVAGPFGSAASTTASGQVKLIPISPKWTKDAIALEDAVEDLLFERVLAEFVSNPDNVPLSFSLVPGKHPAWLNLTSQGKLFGIPRRRDVGNASVEVKLKSQVGGQWIEEPARFSFQVLRVNKAPFFTEEPVLLPKVVAGADFLADLSGFVGDPDLDLGDGLFLDVVSGPSWGTIAPPAILKGSPPASALGVQSWRIRVTDVAGLSAVATVTLEVVKPNLPPQFKSPLVLEVKERQTLEENLAAHASDPEGDPIRFEGVSLPPWASVASDGLLTLKPQHSHVGKHSLSVRLGDGNTKAVGTVEVTVLADPRPPIWLEDPIRIDAVTGQAFALSIADKAQDLDGEPITFSKVSGADWLAVDGAGRVGGLPKQGDLGPQRFVVGAKNSIGTSEATLIVTVKQGNRPPEWKQDPVVIPPAKISAPFSFDLASWVVDPDGDVLRFTRVLAPPWLRLTSDGKVGGTPFASDQGDYAAVFEVTDGKVTVQVGAVGRVGEGNSPPMLKPGAHTFAVKERATFSEDISTKKYVEDPDGDPLQFSLQGAPGWVTLTAAGRLTIKPLFPQVGNHSVRFEVTDGKQKVSAVLTIQVQRDPRPPVWLEDPVEVAGSLNKSLVASLSAKAQDQDGIALTFAKVAGPAWLLVSPSGELSGAPPAAGNHDFRVKVSNDVLSAEATLRVVVRDGALTHRVSLGKSSPDAATEILWLVDVSPESSQFLGGFYRAASQFYRDLDNAGVRHSSAVVATRKFGGQLVDDGGSPVLTTGMGNIDSQFKNLVERAYSTELYNSPIWALSRFVQVTSQATTVVKGLFSQGTPVEVFLMSMTGDYHRQHSQGTAKSHYLVGDYEREATRFFERSGQRFTVTAYDMRCPPAYDPMNPTQRPDFLTLAMQTTGTYYYLSQPCVISFSNVLTSFRHEVARRAHIMAKRRIALPGPASEKFLKVVLQRSSSTTVLPGNKGASDDTWRYHKESQEIEVLWERLRIPVNESDELIISY